MKNEKSTFSVLFYLKKDKMKKSGLVPIHARITINGKQTQFNTKLEVFEANWKSGRAIGKSMEIQRLNSMLDDIKANIRSHFHNQLMRDSYVTPESVKNALLGKEEEALTILSFFEQHNDQYKKKVGAGEATPKTYSRYELTKLRLTEYMKDEYRVSDLPIRQINKVFIENFYLYIIKNHDCSPNTAMKFIQRFRTVINFAQGTGLITADPFANYKLKFEYIERGYLDKDEISRICNKDFASKRLEQVRDIFIFSCMTGLAYADTRALHPRHIGRTSEGRRYIRIRRAKTDVEAFIPLHPIAGQILELYNTTDDDRPVFPLPVRDVLWYEVHGMGVALGMKENLSYHMARHSFGTLTLTAGIPIESIARMMGHTNIDSTQVYAQVTDRKISSDMDRLMERRKPAAGKEAAD
ncbi:site-specific integrase [uncultured Parabacteroides sp.]|uniref:site-specific integrase n=1 Tax=uncultured Parabacteroides sp. TaxID=512312 RepID=UPI00261530C1|nr:site-specific integrase [uncultured Parabacteroides sp.]